MAHQPSSPSNNDHENRASDFKVMVSKIQSKLVSKIQPYLQKTVPITIPIFIIVISLLVIAFSLSRKQTIDLAANDQAAGGNIRPPAWLLEWLNSGDSSMSKLNLQCEKFPDNNAAKGWTLRCKNLPGGGGEDKSQTFILQLNNSQKNFQPYNGTGNSLCCHPCNYYIPPPAPPPRPTPPRPGPVPPPTPPAPGPVLPPPPFDIITWVINITKTSISTCTRIVVTSISIWRRIAVETVSELTTFIGIYIHKCQYHSETMSTEFEMELKRMLQKELLQQIEAAKRTCKSEACLIKYPNALRYQIKNKFNDILRTSFHQISLKIEEGSTDSADGNELSAKHEQISSVEQTNYAEVIEHHQQISVEQLQTEEIIKEEVIIVGEYQEVIEHQEIFVEESAEVTSK